jgi:hypothetical protein
MAAKKKDAARGAPRPSSRRKPAEGNEPTEVTLRLSYAEASLLVVGANVAMGLANSPDADDGHRSMATIAADIVEKLYQAEPALKLDARRIEGEMRSFLTDGVAQDDDDEDDEEIGEPELEGQRWFGNLGEAIGASREIALREGDGRERRLQPLGAGHVGHIAVAIGWSQDVGDYTVLRLDEVSSLRQTGITFDDSDGGLTESCLERLDILAQRRSD